ncbi:MAG: hypothetical protein HQL34_01325 [Alphaproteobacteria bacterium]|nr:hypothetical protein [Alphaproteobacteria bacterium]
MTRIMRGCPWAGTDGMRCYQKMQCGREPGGRNVPGYGVCHVSMMQAATCWMIAGLDSPERERCLRILKGKNCESCPFYLDFQRDVVDAFAEEAAPPPLSFPGADAA